MTTSSSLRRLLVTALLALAGAAGLCPAQTINILGMPWYSSTSTSNSITRGYWFTSPIDVEIRGLMVPDDTSLGTQSVRIVQLPIPPMPYPGPALQGTTLFEVAQAPSSIVIPCSLRITAGQTIGIFGGCGTSPLACSTAATSNWSFSMGGHSFTLSSCYMNANVSGAGNGTVQAGGAFGRVVLFCTPDPLPQQATLPMYISTFPSAATTRGMSFQVPVPLVIRGLRVPDEGLVGTQVLEVSSSSTSLSGTPTNLQQRFYSSGQPSYSIVPCNILCRPGDWITILGACASSSSSTLNMSYGAGSPQAISIGGSSMPLLRAACNHNILTTHDSSQIYTDGGAVGRIEVYYDLGGRASCPSFGSACGFASRSFREDLSAAAFDLENSSLRIAPAGGGYAVTSGGAYLPPTSLAQPLPLGDDDHLLVGLLSPFPHGSSNITAMNVDSNGLVYANGAVWGVSHDFDPSAPGGGRVVHETIGTRWCVTWWNVFTFNYTIGSTMQLQFDLVTGDVTYVWLTMDRSHGSFGVQFKPAGSTVIPEPIDLSASLANGGFLLSATERLSPWMRCSARPLLGQSIQLETHFSNGAVVGFTQLGLQSQNIDLTAYGAPGCHSYLQALATTVFPVTGSMQSVPFTVPMVQAALGLHVFAQTALYDPAANAFGVITSNGLEMILDMQ